MCKHPWVRIPPHPPTSIDFKQKYFPSCEVPAIAPAVNDTVALTLPIQSDLSGYTPPNRRMVAEMVRLAHFPDRLSRLAKVLDDELGHDLAFAVERGKIAANGGDGQSRILLDQIERGLFAPLPAEGMARSLQRHADLLSGGVHETPQIAGIAAADVQQVTYVGGSSLMAMVSDTMKAQFPAARHSFSEVFTAVTDGLAIAAGR